MATNTPKLKTFDENEGEIFSRPTMQIEFRVHTQQSHYIATRCLDAVDRSLYLFAGHFLHRGMSAAQLEKEEATVLGRFDAFAASVDDEIQRLKEVLRSEGIVKLPSVSYTKPEIIVLRVSNPLTRRFLKLIAKLDDVSRMIDCAWIAGALTPGQRTDALFTYRNALRKISAMLRVDAGRLAKELRASHSTEPGRRAQKQNASPAQAKAAAGRKQKSAKKTAAKARLAKDESKKEQSDPGVLRSAEIKPKRSVKKAPQPQSESVPDRQPSDAQDAEPSAATATA